MAGRAKAKSGDKKRKIASGAKAGTDKNGHKYIRGWRAIGNGMTVSYFAGPTKNTKASTNKKGEEFHTWLVKISSPLGVSQVQGMYYPNRMSVFVPECNLVLSVSKDYSGPYLSK